MSFSGMLFVMLLGLLIFGPEKLSQRGKQIGRVLAELKSFIRDFKLQSENGIEGASKRETIAPASLPQSTVPTEIGFSGFETHAFGSEYRRVEAFHG